MGDDETTFARRVAAKAHLKLKAQREGRRPVWFGLGMMGTVGWSVAVPGARGGSCSGVHVRLTSKVPVNPVRSRTVRPVNIDKLFANCARVVPPVAMLPIPILIPQAILSPG